MPPFCVTEPLDPMRALRLLVLLLCASSSAFAQESEAEAQALLIEQAVARGTAAAPLSVAETYGTIVDFGLSEVEVETFADFALRRQGNVALVRQIGLDASGGIGNTAVLEQRGTGNLVVVLQQGDGNVTSTLQVGRRNVIGIRLRGVDNRLGTAAEAGVEQIGDGNVYLLDLAGNGQAIAPTLQVGSGNQVVQVGEVATPFGVRQFGDGMRMIIRHNGAQ